MYVYPIYIHTYICLVLYDCIMYIIRRPLPSLGLGGAPGSTAGCATKHFPTRASTKITQAASAAVKSAKP